MNPLQESISKCTVKGNIVHLPTEVLTNYADVKKAFMNAGAVYKKNTFVFPGDAQPYIDRLMGGEKVNLKKEFQFFATPDDLADHMVELAGLDPLAKTLEPSAGHGAIIRAIHRAIPGKVVGYFELMPENISILLKMDNVVRLGTDFLKCEQKNEYDFVIANPPFSKNQDIDHIYKMYQVCKSGGTIVTIASTHWKTGQEQKCKNFRYWLEDEVDYEEFPIHGGAFKESGTNVSAVILVILK